MPDQQSLFDDFPEAAPAPQPRAGLPAQDPDVVTPNQAAVMRLFEGSMNDYQGGLTDSALVTVYEARMGSDPEHFPVQSPSGLRTRRRELTDKGRLRSSGRTVRLDSGRHAIEWVVNR